MRFDPTPCEQRGSEQRRGTHGFCGCCQLVSRPLCLPDPTEGESRTNKELERGDTHQSIVAADAAEVPLGFFGSPAGVASVEGESAATTAASGWPSASASNASASSNRL